MAPTLWIQIELFTFSGLLQPEHGEWRSGGGRSGRGAAPSSAHGGAAVSVRCQLLHCAGSAGRSCCRLPRHCSSCQHCSRGRSCWRGRGLLQETPVCLLLVTSWWTILPRVTTSWSLQYLLNIEWNTTKVWTYTRVTFSQKKVLCDSEWVKVFCWGNLCNLCNTPILFVF